MASGKTNQLEAHAEFSQQAPPVRHPLKPSREEAPADQAPAVCPCCQQAIPTDQTHTVGLIRTGVSHIWYGLKLIFTSVFRVVRLGLASAFYCLGLVGSLARKAGSKVAHPSDRHRLDRWTGHATN